MPGFIMEGARRSQQLIKDLLQYSRAINENVMLNAINCEDVLTKALDNLKFTIEENHAVITRDTLPRVEGDAVKLIQVFQNLIGNAIKFKKDEPPRIHISAKKDGRRWIFSVKDNGIDPEFYNRIFIILKRLHARESYAGTGIGLAICKRIIEQHGGEIWVESQAQKGSTFYFSLPALLTVF